MKKIFCLLIFSTLLFAQSPSKEKFFEGNSRYLSHEDDSVEMVKKHLLYLGFRDVITKQLQDLGLEVSLFWQKFDAKYLAKLSSELEKLEPKKAEDGKIVELTADQKKNLDEKIRTLKLSLRATFGKLDRAIQSYQISKISRSPRNPKMRYMTMEAKVNHKMLNRIYYRLVRGGGNSNFSKLIVDVDYHLVNGTYADLGVSNERDFTSVVNQHWGDWFKKNKPDNVDSVLLSTSKEKRLIAKYDTIPKEEIANQVPAEMRNSLLLKLDFTIEKRRHNPEYKEFSFSLKGGIYLVEVDTGRVLAHENIDVVEKSYTQLEHEQLSTALANVVYRLPMGQFTKIANKIGKLGRVKNSQMVVLYGFQKIDEALKLVENVKTNGIRYNLDVALQKIGHNKATYLFYLDGNRKQLIDLIKFVIDRNKDPKKQHKYDIVDSTSSIGVKFY